MTLSIAEQAEVRDNQIDALRRALGVLDAEQLDKDMGALGAALAGEHSGRMSATGNLAIPFWTNREGLEAVDDIHLGVIELLDALARIDLDALVVPTGIDLDGIAENQEVVKAIMDNWDAFAGSLHSALLGRSKSAVRKFWLDLASAAIRFSLEVE